MSTADDRYYLIQDRQSGGNLFEGTFEQFCDTFGGVQDESGIIRMCLDNDYQCFIEITGLRPDPHGLAGAFLVFTSDEPAVATSGAVAGDPR